MALLDGKVAIVTGSGRGIGRSEALCLARYGAKVVVNDPGTAVDGSGTDNTPAQQVVDEIKAAGGTAIANFADVSNYAQAEQLIQQAVDTWGRLDILVNNAGILRDRIIWNMTEDDWDAVMRVHMKGTFNCTKHAVVYWRGKNKAGEGIKGRIINTVSAAMFGNAGQSNYGAAKGGIMSFTQAIALEVASMGITVNAIRPGGSTRMSASIPSTGALAMRDTSGAPKAVEGFDPSDVMHSAEVVAYLASDDAQYMSGQLLKASGNSVGVMDGWKMRSLKEKKNAGWTANEFVTVFPRVFGAGPTSILDALS